MDIRLRTLKISAKISKLGENNPFLLLKKDPGLKVAREKKYKRKRLIPRVLTCWKRNPVDFLKVFNRIVRINDPKQFSNLPALHWVDESPYEILHSFTNRAILFEVSLDALSRGKLSVFCWHKVKEAGPMHYFLAF